MTSLRFIFAALLASTLLVSCSSFEHFDSKHPTVAQQDAYDVSWGLPPRKVRGNPKLRYQAKAEPSAAPMSLEPSGPAAAPVLAPAPAAPSRGTSSGPATIPPNLR
jgi:hypothetical protein